MIILKAISETVILIFIIIFMVAGANVIAKKANLKEAVNGGITFVKNKYYILSFICLFLGIIIDDLGQSQIAQFLYWIAIFSVVFKVFIAKDSK